MNVGAYVPSGGGDYPPLLDEKLFKKLQKNGRVLGRILAVREIKSPKFKGLGMDLKTADTKYSFLLNFERYDIAAVCRQLNTEETDDWIGQSIKFVTKRGTDGKRVFVNVENPKRKK